MHSLMKDIIRGFSNMGGDVFHKNVTEISKAIVGALMLVDHMSELCSVVNNLHNWPLGPT